MDDNIENSISSKNKLLYDQLYIFSLEFDILPKKKHTALAIKYVDLQECRIKFIEELSFVIREWVYSDYRYKELVENELKKENNDYRATKYVANKIKQKFRRNKQDEFILQGQFGELVLYTTIQRLFGAAPLLRKMPITTSDKFERFGADAIHYKFENEKNMIFLGEAKTYKSKYRFNEALKDSLESIINTYDSHRTEIETYCFDDFIEKEYIEVAKKYSDSTLENCEVQLVCIIIYNETSEINELSEKEINARIQKIIAKRCIDFDKNNFQQYENKNIFNRINYIFFPIWKLDELLKDFGDEIR